MYTVGTLTIFTFGGGNSLFWLLNSQISAHSGREDVVEQISGHLGSKQPREGGAQRGQSIFLMMDFLQKPHLLLFTTF